MFLNFLSTNCRHIVTRNCSTVSNKKWDLFTAVCVERKPLITPLLNDIENEYQKYLVQTEYERSYKSNFELRQESDIKQAELLKQGSSDVDVVVKQTSQDFIDAAVDELNKFTCAERITNADKKNDQTSLRRKLDKHLVLVIKQKLGNEKHYLLPQTIRNDGETLRQTADRLLSEQCGEDLKAQIYGNAPTGFYKYKYPSDIQEKKGSLGAKVFIYFARFNKGDVTKKEADYKWLDRKELKKELHPSYHNSIVQFLIDED